MLVIVDGIFGKYETEHKKHNRKLSVKEMY
jgi:hypothetical protein